MKPMRWSLSHATHLPPTLPPLLGTQYMNQFNEHTPYVSLFGAEKHNTGVLFVYLVLESA